MIYVKCVLKAVLEAFTDGKLSGLESGTNSLDSDSVQSSATRLDCNSVQTIVSHFGVCTRVRKDGDRDHGTGAECRVRGARVGGHRSGSSRRVTPG